MGQEVFLYRFGSENNPYNCDLAIKIMTRGAENPNVSGAINYPDGGGCGEVFRLDRYVFDGCMFAHFGGPVFAARIYELAGKTSCLIFWSDGPADGPFMGVTRQDYLASIPADLVQRVEDEGNSVAVIRDLDHMADLIGRHILTPLRVIRCV